MIEPPGRSSSVSGQPPFEDVSQLGALLDHAPVGAIVRTSGTDVILYWSRGAEELYGWTATEALGKVTHALLATRFPISREAVEEGLRSSGTWTGELVQSRRDGQSVTVASRQVVQRADDGRPGVTLELNIDISERKRAEESMRASDERFRLLVDNVQDYAIFLLSPEGRVVTWNEGARRLKGYEADEIIGQSFTRFYPADEIARELPWRLLSQAQRDGRVEHEGWRVRKDGSLFWADVVITALRDEHGVLRGFAKITRDLTERREAEEARARASREEGARAAAEAAQAELRASRDQLAAILAGVVDGIMAFDAAGRVVFSNEAAARMCGFASTEAMVGATQSEIVSSFDLFDEKGAPFQLEKLPSRLVFGGAELRGEQAPAETLVRFRVRATGEERSSLVSATAIRNDAGDVIMSVSIFRDVTERLREQDAARFLAAVNLELTRSLDYEVTLSRVAELAVPALADWCVIDMLTETGQLRRLAVAHVNANKVRVAAEVSARYPEEPAASGGVFEVLRTGKARLHSEVTDTQLEMAARDPEHLALLRSLELRSYIIVPLVRHGRTLGAITLVSAESGRRYGERELATAEDLAVRAGLAMDNAMLYREAQEQAATQVELNAALREAMTELQQAMQTRDEFLAAISHDLKNPIASIKGIAQLAARRLSGDDGVNVARVREHLERIDAVATRAANQVDELLDVARMEMHQSLDLDRQPTDLVRLVRQIVDEHQQRTERHQISFDASEPELIGMWDASRMNRVLENLVENALKYSPEGGPIRLRLSREPEPRNLAVLSIEDHGLGIPADDLPRIFERFRRGTNVVGRISGTGIGLASARHIVEGHGGTISAASEPGRGATFTVRLPLHDQAID